MLKINKITVVVLIVLAVIPMTVAAQNNTNSPYTRYGYGTLADHSFGAGRAMGGLGYGLRSSKQINPLNPASYSSVDSLTFIFDFGVSGQMSWFSDETNKEKHKNGNLEYMAMQFPIHRRVALSFGILPYSYVGYRFGSHISDKAYSEIFTGTGGLNNIYGGLSVDLWKKRLSFGANVGYLFGKVSHNQSLLFDSDVTGASTTSRLQVIRVKDMKLDFGLQYTHPVSKKESYTFGLAYSPGKRLNAESTDISQTNSSTGTGYVMDTTIVSNQIFDISNSFGFGLSYVKQNKLTLAADYLYEPWSKARFFDSNEQFRNRMRIALGGEYVHDITSKAFFSKVRYRAGVHYGNSYLQIKDNGYKETGGSIGFGLPLIDNRSLVNVSFEYVKIKPEMKLLVEEQYFRITINYTFNEAWFYKFKVD